MKLQNKSTKSLMAILYSVRYAGFIIPTIITAAIMASVLDLMTANQEVKTNNNKLVFWELLSYIVFKTMSASFLLLNNLLSSSLISCAYQNASKMLFSEYFALEFMSFTGLGIGAVQFSITRRTSALTKLLQILTLRFAINGIYLAVILSRLSVHIKLTTYMRAGLVLSFFIVIISMIQYQRAKLRKQINRATERNSEKVLDVLLNYERIRAYRNEDVELAKYHDILADTVYYRQLYEVSYVVIAFITTIAFLLTTCSIYHSLNFYESIGKSQLEEIFFIAMKLNNTINAILQDFNNVYTSYFNFKATGMEEDEIVVTPETDKFVLNRFRDKIDVINLNIYFDKFRALANINCVIKKGEKVAICGPSSSGKSVFLKAILGLYPYKGAIIIDGFEQKQVSSDSLLNNIAYISQNPVLFDSSIMDNLKMGNESLESTKVMNLCEIFRLHALFKQLGYDKAVGPLGNNLSGGQKQKVVFMRTLLKNAPLLLMDQAMSALDIQTEKFFLESLKKYLVNSTLIFVAKNVRTLASFDKILYFDKGKLVDSGDFNTLMSSSEQFKKYYNESLIQKDELK